MSKLTPFKYAIVQFHRNPLRGEPFNLGLLMVSAKGPAYVKFETNFKTALRLDPIEYQAVEACIAEIGEAIHRSSDNPSFLDKFRQLYTGKVQLGEVRGGLAADIGIEAESLFQTFVEHPRIQRGRGPEKGVARDLKLIFQEHQLLGRSKVRRHYLIDQVKIDFGYAYDTKHVAIEAVDLTLPTREQRLEKVGPAAGKFQYLHDKHKDKVTRFAAVKTNGVDASWELRHLKDASDRVFDIDSDTNTLIGEIGRHLAAV